MRLQVKDFMSSPVTTAIAEDSVADLKELMKEKGISAVPIVSYTNDTIQVDVTIRGIITLTDIQQNTNPDASVADIMNESSVHVVHTDSSAQAAAKMMLRHNVHHIVVMDKGEIKGIISSLDFVKLVAEYSLEE